MARRLQMIKGEGIKFHCDYSSICNRIGTHTEECRSAWRALILSYKSN